MQQEKNRRKIEERKENQKGEFSIHEKPFFQDTEKTKRWKINVKSVQQKKQTAPSFFLLKKEKQKKIVLQKCARIQIRIEKKIKDWEKRPSKTKKNFQKGVTKVKETGKHVNVPRAQRRLHSSQQQHKTNTTHKGWRSVTMSPWTSWHTGGSRQDTHSTPVPERGGCGWPKHKHNSRCS